MQSRLRCHTWAARSIAALMLPLAVTLLMTACLAILGCQAVPTSERPKAAMGQMPGAVHGGQQPVSGASIGLYAAGTSGVGSAATSLLSGPITTDSNGGFTLTGEYTCPRADAQVFILARGGNPGLPQGNVNRSLFLMAMLGRCGDLGATTFVSLNEVTTVAAIWPLANYMSSPTNVGSAEADPLFNDAVLQAQHLVSLGTGSAPGAAVPGYAVPVAKINDLADILASCVNSSGGVAGDGSACGRLFSASTPPGGVAPSDTVTAALRIAQNPQQHVMDLYNQVSPLAPFLPTLATSPADWSIDLLPIPATPVIAPSSSVFDAPQTVTIVDSTPGAVIRYSLDGGVPTASSPIYSAPFVVPTTAVVSAAATLSGVSSTVASAAITIVPKTATKLAFAVQPANSGAGAWLSPSVIVTVLDAAGGVNTDAVGNVTLSLAAGAGATLNGTLIQPIIAGQAVFPDLSLAAGGQYSLLASSNGLLSAISATFSVAPPSSRGEQATSATAFTDTVGMNLHLAFGGTLYSTNFPLIQASLQDLGIHHVRDGLVDYGAGTSFYYTEYQQLAALGIRSDFITSVGQPEALLKAYPTRVNGMEALEAPNEYDASGDGSWATHLRSFLSTLKDAVHGANPMTGVTVYGPSLVNQNWTSSTANSYAQLGDVSSLVDAGNLHNYAGGRNPGTAGWTPEGYGSIAFALSTARQSWSGLPSVTTEVGYWDDPTMVNSLPDAVIGRYTPRIFLEQYLHGIVRTYLYDLVDTNLSEDAYGLMRSDGTRKPAYYALQGLMQTASDNGPGFTPGKLDWSLTGAAPDVHHLLLQRSNGTFLLALWVEEPCWDVNAQAALDVAPQSVVLRFGVPVSVISAHVLQSSGLMVSQPVSTRTSSLPLTLSDQLTIIELHP